jgi:hypothetical protein
LVQLNIYEIKFSLSLLPKPCLTKNYVAFIEKPLPNIFKRYWTMTGYPTQPQPEAKIQYNKTFYPLQVKFNRKI